MISPSFDIKQLMECIKNKSYLEVINILNTEATEAERLLFRRKPVTEETAWKSKVYADALKQFIFYLRYKVITRRMDTENAKLFVSFHDGLQRSEKSRKQLFIRAIRTHL